MVRFSMDPIREGTPVRSDDVKRSRPWLRAIFSGAVFGTIGAAATHWLSLHAVPLAERSRPSFGRNWITAAGGISSGVVALYSNLRAEDAPARRVLVDITDSSPAKEISTEEVTHGRLQSAGERSL